MEVSSLYRGWRTLWLDLRCGALSQLIVSVTLAVAALTAVGFFADRLQSGITRNAAQLLGGDAVVVGDSPTPAEFERQAQDLGLQTVRTLTFATMARATDAQGGASRLVALKAVNPGYPLRGALRVANAPDAGEYTAADIPQPGKVWLDLSALNGLDLRMGDTLLLGDAQFAIDRIIILEPDRGGGAISFSPRVMINAADVPSTALVQPASRITYRMAVRGNAPPVAQFSQWAQQRIQQAGGAELRGIRLDTLKTGQPQMQRTLEHAQNFLSLVALLTALLCAVAVALGARSFAQQHLDDCALLRVLGQSQKSIARTYLCEFVLIGIFASALGTAIGLAVHYAFVAILADLLNTALPAPGLWPALLGVSTGLILLLGFGLPPVLQLAQVPPLRIIRRDMGGLKASALLVWLLGVGGFSALLLLISGSVKLGLIAVGGFLCAIALFAFGAWTCMRALTALVRSARMAPRLPHWLALAARQLAGQPVYSVVQICALAVGMLALMLLILLRTDLIDSWRQATPGDAPNRFVINIMPEQGEAFQRALFDAGVTQYDWYPMIRGRLESINGQAVNPSAYPDNDTRRLVDREFNVSTATELPYENEVTAGQWSGGDTRGISVESGIAERLGLRIGDRLLFNMGGILHEGVVTSIRKLNWSSMHVNFFVIFTTPRIEDAPFTYITAFMAPQAPGFDNALVRAFPNITLIDLSSTLRQIHHVLSQVINAIEILFAFSLIAGMLVLFTTVVATREERARAFAIMRALGARARWLRGVQRGELATCGAIAGLLAGLASTAMGWALARFVFDFTWHGTWWLLPTGAASGAALALIAGWWGLREILNRPVIQTLRHTTP